MRRVTRRGSTIGLHTGARASVGLVLSAAVSSTVSAGMARGDQHERLTVRVDGMPHRLTQHDVQVQLDRATIDDRAQTAAAVTPAARVGTWRDQPFAGLSPAVVVVVGSLALAAERRRRAGLA